jgi:hypothetical protein
MKPPSFPRQTPEMKAAAEPAPKLGAGPGQFRDARVLEHLEDAGDRDRVEGVIEGDGQVLLREYFRHDPLLEGFEFAVVDLAGGRDDGGLGGDGLDLLALRGLRCRGVRDVDLVPGESRGLS